jgi:hypothetical protein
MEPSWSDFKKILRCLEEISQANCSMLHQLSGKMGDFKIALASLTQRMDVMEFEFQQLKAQVLPQHSTSASINHFNIISVQFLLKEHLYFHVFKIL